MKPKKNPDPKPAPKSDEEKMNKLHIERWAPRLLLDLMGLEHNLWVMSEEDRKTFHGWLDEWREKWAGLNWFNVAKSLAGAGSDNHPYLILGCLLWKYGREEPKWLQTLDFLFGCQIHGTDPGGAFELACFGHSETHSTTYGHMPWAIALATKAFLSRPGGAVAVGEKGGEPWSPGWVGEFLQTTTTFWQLGAVPWPAENGRRSAHGFYDNSPTVPACGERSTMAHAFMNPLGGLLAMAHGLPFKSNAMEWAGVIAAANGVMENTVDPGTWGNPREGAKILQQRGVRTWREICFAYWYSEGVTASWCPGPRLNGNTPDTKFSVAFTDSRTVAVGFPWVGGRGEATRGIGGDCRRSTQSGALIAEGNLGIPEKGYEPPLGTALEPMDFGRYMALSCPLPVRTPDLLITIDRNNGVRIS